MNRRIVYLVLLVAMAESLPNFMAHVKYRYRNYCRSRLPPTVSTMSNYVQVHFWCQSDCPEYITKDYCALIPAQVKQMIKNYERDFPDKYKELSEVFKV